jgi:hypothetical protein
VRNGAGRGIGRMTLLEPVYDDRYILPQWSRPMISRMTSRGCG